MLKWIETTGRSEEDAISAALFQLGLERDDVSIEVIERAKSGFLGFGSNPAKVRVSYEEEDGVPRPRKSLLEEEEEPAPALVKEVKETKEVKEEREKSRNTRKQQTKEQPEPQTSMKVLKRAIRSIAKECSDDEGWIFSAELRNQLDKRFPDFDVRNFGYSKFTPFIESLDIFEVKRTRSGLRHVQLVYFKLKK